MRNRLRERLTLFAAIPALLITPFLKLPLLCLHFVLFLTVGLVLDFRSHRTLTRKPFWALVFGFLFLFPLIGDGDKTLFSFFSKRLFLQGIEMSMKVSLFVLWLTILMDRLTASKLLAFFERKGMGKLGLRISTALNVLPLLSESAKISWDALKMKKRRKTPSLFYHFLRTFLINIVRMAEGLSCAAYIRGYGSDDMDSDRQSGFRKDVGPY